MSALFVIVLVGAFIFHLGKHLAFTSQTGPAKPAGSVLCTALVAAVIAGVNLGTSLDGSGDDPLYGAATRRRDFTPTEGQQVKHGILVFILVSAVGGAGVSAGCKERRELRERLEARRKSAEQSTAPLPPTGEN